MKLGELPHWFAGNASLIVDRYISEKDADNGLNLALRALKKEFGRKSLTAKQMLQEVLIGDKIPEKDFSTLKIFTLRLEKAYQIAIETKRQATFDLPETINEVLRTKLPHLALKWAKKISDIEASLLDIEDMPDLTFSQFVTFVKKQTDITETMTEILKQPDTQKAANKQPVRMAATESGSKSSMGPSVTSSTPQSGPPVSSRVFQNASAGNRPIQRGNGPNVESRCAVCPNAAHLTTDCRRFAGMTAPEKSRIVKEKVLCIRCLGTKHLLRDCPTQITCQECGSPHHRAMHGVSLFPRGGRRTNAPPS